MIARDARSILALAILLPSIAACSLGIPGSPSTPAAGPSGQLSVSAAVSLSDGFRALQAGFAVANPGVRTTFNFAGSQLLVSQLQQGAPADVIATADARTMRTLADSGRLDGPSIAFASNHLEIVVAKGNPKHVSAIADLARPEVTLVLAAPDVPQGAYALRALAAAGVSATPRSLELDARAVLNRVLLGEADAGIVYATDVASAGGKVDSLALPPAYDVRATYPIAVLKEAAHRAAAHAFVDYVLSPGGHAVLARFGFGAP